MNHLRLFIFLVTVTCLQACSGGTDNQTPAPAAADKAAAAIAEPVTADSPARVFIASPSNGETVTSPITVVFGIEGFAVAPAGTYDENTGHHHLLIDAELPALDQPFPADAQHIHFGKGQTETELELTPGEHTLQLVLGDGNHVPHASPIVSDQITVTVSEAD